MIRKIKETQKQSNQGKQNFDGGVNKVLLYIQSNLNGSNIFGIMKICSRYG